MGVIKKFAWSAADNEKAECELALAELLNSAGVMDLTDPKVRGRVTLLTAALVRKLGLKEMEVDVTGKPGAVFVEIK